MTPKGRRPRGLLLLKAVPSEQMPPKRLRRSENAPDPAGPSGPGQTELRRGPLLRVMATRLHLLAI